MRHEDTKTVKCVCFAYVQDAGGRSQRMETAAQAPALLMFSLFFVFFYLLPLRGRRDEEWKCFSSWCVNG